MKKKTGIIYIYIDKTNGMKYVGQTVDFKQREKGHLSNKDRNNYFNNVLRKRGVNNFEVWKSMTKMSKKDMDFWEETLIDLYDTLKPNGYNLTPGGKNNSHHKDSKERMSKTQIKRFRNKENCPMYGKHHSDETKEKIRKSRLGSIMSQETKEKISQSSKGRVSWNTGIPMKEEIKEKISKKTKGENNPFYNKHHNNEMKQELRKIKIRKGLTKKVICLNTQEIFECVRDVEKKYDIDHSSISRCCKGKQQTAGKDENGNRLQWLYYEEIL
jgi:group I intron endonuclease